MKRIGFLILLLGLFSCSAEQKVLPVVSVSPDAPKIVLQPVHFKDLNNFEHDKLAEIIPAFAKSCQALEKQPALLEKSAIKINPDSYLKICRRFVSAKISDDDQMRHFIESNFRPYLVTDALNSEGKFTSYYEPEIKASRTKGGPYQYPIYGRPDDLIEINLSDFDRTLPSRRLVARLNGNKAVPYYTRAEIEKNGTNGPVILWADDPVDIYLMQIQGPAVAVLDDGSMIRVGYAENNGHSFVGIGQILLKKGLLKPGEASMDKIRDWLKAHPQAAKKNMSENPRFIFHRLSEADGPVGALGVSLTAGRSLAVDQNYVPLGTLLWLETTAPDKSPLEKMVAAQDVGGAIKGVVRGDYFWGHGEEALLSAGKMNASGRYYILLPKDGKVKIGE